MLAVVKSLLLQTVLTIYTCIILVYCQDVVVCMSLVQSDLCLTTRKTFHKLAEMQYRGNICKISAYMLNSLFCHMYDTIVCSF